MLLRRRAAAVFFTLFAVLVAALVGTLIGLAAGSFRGWLDSVLMRGVDVLLAFPYLLLALAIVAALGPGLQNATLALVTDYDCWHATHDAVTVGAVIAVMQKNVAKAKEIIVALAPAVPDPGNSPATSALAGAIITDPDSITAEVRDKLQPLIGKYIPRKTS